MMEPISGERQRGAGKKNRPRLNIPLTRVELICELIAAAAFLGALAFLWAAWSSLPAQIPVHFNLSGQADRWGDRRNLFWEFATISGLYIGLSVLQRFPHIYNYPFELTPHNVHRQYLVARQLLAFVKAEVICFLALIEWHTVRVAGAQSPSPGAWFLLAMPICIFCTIAWYFVAASKAK